MFQSLVVVIVALLFASHPSRSAGLWDVLPTPLDQMETAGIPKTVDAISDVLVDSAQDEQFRFEAAMALGQLGDAQAIPVLIASLSDQNSVVRAGAALGLGYMPSNDSVEPLCDTALYDKDEGPRHRAVTALNYKSTDMATRCLVKVAGNEYETKQTRLHSLNILAHQVPDRQGFEELIPTLKDPDPDVRGMAAITLSKEYADERELTESLLITKSLIDAALDEQSDDWTYRRMVERLEEIAGRNFINDEEQKELVPSVRTEVSARITEWAVESL